MPHEVPLPAGVGRPLAFGVVQGPACHRGLDVASMVCKLSGGGPALAARGIDWVMKGSDDR